jgi:hypothetical protein
MADIRHQVSVSDTATPQLICNDPPRRAAVSPDQALEESLCCPPVPTRLQKHIDHLPVLVDSSPQIVLFALNFHEDLIYIESITIALVLSAKSSWEFGPELRAPKPDSLIANRYAPFRHQILDISMAQIEPVVEPNGVANDFRRESVTFVSDHPRIIQRQLLTCMVISWE